MQYRLLQTKCQRFALAKAWPGERHSTDFAPGAIDKSRYLVLFQDNVFEVDEFYGENEGLVLAEIELNHEEDEFEKPDWLGEEVTGNPLYYNSSLTKLPYSTWK